MKQVILKKANTQENKEKVFSHLVIPSGFYPKNMRWMIDQDYKGLSPEHKAWLNVFYSEYLKGKFAKDDSNCIHTRDERKSCYDRSNASRRCTYNIKATGGAITYIEDCLEELDQFNKHDLYEDALITMIDFETKQQNRKKK